MEFTDGSSVIVSNFFMLDDILYRLWLLGLNVEQAIKHCIKHAQRKPLPKNPSLSSIQSFIISQYRNFDLLESFLHHPKTLLSQNIFYLHTETRQFMITSYYDFDEQIIREFLGKKLTHRARKDLEDVSAKTRVPVLGCRRMFDNMKRILKRVEDAQGDIVSIIAHDFCLPEELASQYAVICFMNQYRFETQKKRIAQIPLTDILQAANLIVKHLTEKSNYALKELDLSIAQDARDLKSLIFNQKDFTEQLRNAIVGAVTSMPDNSLEKSQIVNAFNKVIKPMLSIVASLSHSKEQRDCFNQLLEKCVDPLCVGMGWKIEEMALFFSCTATKFEEIQLTGKKRYSTQFKKIMVVFGGICTRFASHFISNATPSHQVLSMNRISLSSLQRVREVGQDNSYADGN